MQHLDNVYIWESPSLLHKANVQNRLDSIVKTFLLCGDGQFQKRSNPPCMEEINNTPCPPRTSYTNLRQFPTPLPEWKKFPLWLGYGSFLEQPNGVAQELNAASTHNLREFPQI